MEISSSMFSVVAKQSLKLAKSANLDSLFSSDDLGIEDEIESEEANLLPDATEGKEEGASKGGEVSPNAGSNETNPNDPEATKDTPEMIITGGYPEWMHGPLIGLAGLLDICSPADLNDIQNKNKSDGKVEDPYCCDCGEGGVPVVGGGYILMKTLEKVRELQKSRLKSFVKQYKSGKLNKGQALLGITGVLNNSLHSKNGDLIPTALEIPVGEDAVKITMKDAVERSDMDWIKAANDGLGSEVVGPIIGENMGTLSGGLLTRNDMKGVGDLNEVMPDWSKSIQAGAMSGKPAKYNMSGLTDDQAKDVVVASSVVDKRAIAA